MKDFKILFISILITFFTFSFENSMIFYRYVND